MEYIQQLQLIPFIRKEGFKYKSITLTDITMHTAKKQPTNSIGEKIKQAFISSKPGRVFFPIQKLQFQEEKMPLLNMLNNDQEFINFVHEEEKNGYKILLKVPQDGIPLLAGKDTIEFIHSKNGKRILRALAKDEPVS